MSQRILIVDDEPDMLVLLERILRDRTPYAVISTNSPLEVPELLREQPVDLVITDLSMPRMDGLDILKHVRDTGKGELVVLITAFGDYSTAERARELGVYDYIHKPFRKEEILGTVEDAMATQRERRAQ